MTAPEVLIVIVNWNRREALEQLLADLRELNYSNNRVVVIDNASTDGSAESVAAHFSSVRLVRNSENLGGSGGFNTGMRLALEEGNCSYVWLLDNDVRVEREALSALVDVMEKDPAVGLAGSGILDAANPDIFVEVGARVNWGASTSLPLLKGESGQEVHEVTSADYVAACSALVRMEALRQVGLMDEGYFLLWDDIDFGLRFRKAGWKVAGVPASRVRHADFSLKRESPLRRYYSTRNALYFFARHAPGLSERLKSLERAMAAVLLFRFWGYRGFSRAATLGIRDFLAGKAGKSSRFFESELTFRKISPREWKGLFCRHVFLFPEALVEVAPALEKLPPDPGRRVRIVAESYKKNLFRGAGLETFCFDALSQKSMLDCHRTIRREKPDVILSTKAFFSPLLGLCNSFSDILILRDEEFYIRKKDPLMPLKYLLTIALSKTLPLVLLPFVPAGKSPRPR
ncbi:MAG: glycosyltransferase family 2 protein [bacterium]